MASGKKPDGGYERVWFSESLASDEVTFESGVFLLLKSKASSLKIASEPVPSSGPEPFPGPVPEPEPPSGPDPEPEPVSGPSLKTFRITGNLPPEVWNRFGTKILPKLRSGSELKIGIGFSVDIEDNFAKSFETEVKQILDDLGLSERIKIE